MVSFLGIVLIVSPDLRTIERDALLALGSGFFAGIAYLYVRRLKATEEALSIVFWFATFSVVATALPAIPSLYYVISDPLLMLALVGIGVGAGAGQVGLTYAFHRPEHEHAMLVMPVGYPANDAKVPEISRKGLADISDFIE